MVASARATKSMERRSATRTTSRRRLLTRGSRPPRPLKKKKRAETAESNPTEPALRLPAARNGQLPGERAEPC